MNLLLRSDLSRIILELGTRRLLDLVAYVPSLMDFLRGRYCLAVGTLVVLFASLTTHVIQNVRRDSEIRFRF